MRSTASPGLMRDRNPAPDAPTMCNLPTCILPLLFAGALCTGTLYAQDGIATSRPAGQVGDAQPGPAGEVVHPPTPAERLAKLEAELAKLRAELDFLRRINKQGGLPTRVKHALKLRQLDAKIFNPPKAPAHATTKGVRLLGDAEKAELGADVVFTVDGLPVTRSQLDDAIDYLSGLPHEASDGEIQTQAIGHLIELLAAQAAFPKTAITAHAKILAAQKKIRAGTPFAEVARKVSEGPSGQQGGDLGYVGRVGMDFFFTKAAFSLKEGEVSEVVASTFGYHLLQVTGIKKGKTRAEDQVKVSHIVTLYDPDIAKVRQVQMKVKDGKVQVAFATQELRKLAPNWLR